MIKPVNSPDKSDTYREALAWRQACKLQTPPAQVFTDTSEDVWSALKLNAAEPFLNVLYTILPKVLAPPSNEQVWLL